MLDARELATATAAIVKGHVAQATAPLIERIETLEKRKPEKGEKGDQGLPGESIRGEIGVGVAGALIDRSGILILTLSDGTTRDLGVVVGKDGLDGKDGTDALPAEPVEEESPLSDEEKTALISSMLRQELGADELIELPDLAPAEVKPQPQAPQLIVHNHMPKRGVEKTVVTKHDERGRILEFERHEVGG